MASTNYRQRDLSRCAQPVMDARAPSRDVDGQGGAQTEWLRDVSKR